MSVREKLADVGIRLRNYSGTQKTTCPQCSRDRKNKTEPCLSVTFDDKGVVWNCHHCQWNGAANERTDGEFRPQRRGPVKIEHKPSDLPANVVAHFAKRGIPEEVLARNGVGFQQEWMPGCEPGQTVGAITFPYRRGGEVVNIKFRTHDKRFKQVKDAEKIYYGLDDIAGSSVVVIVEGEIDKLSCEAAGIKHVVSVPDGAPKQVQDEQPTAEDDRKFEYVWNCKDAFEGVSKIILATDADDPGQALAEELSRRYGKERCWRVTWPTSNDVVCKDANDVLTTHGAQALREVIEGAQPYPIKSLFDSGNYENATLRVFRGERLKAYHPGWSNLSQYYNVRPGELSIVTGVPNSGKSQFIDALVMNMLERHHWRVSYCSFENDPGHDHIPKLIELHVGAPFHDGPTPRMSEAEMRRGHEWLKGRVSFIRAEDESPTIDWILEKARAAVMRYGIKGLVIDPYNEIESRRPSNMSETEYVSELLSKVKRFAQGHGVHVWFVAHPNKMYRDKNGEVPVPTLYDISGSANWVNKADMGLVVERDWDSNRVIIHVRKVRFKQVGKIGDATLIFDRPTGRYSEETPETRSWASGDA